jgi:hypothetical protein
MPDCRPQVPSQQSAKPKEKFMLDAPSAQNKPILLDAVSPPTHRLPVNEGHALLASTEPRESKLAAALATARERCKAAAKDRRNEYQKYDYASSESIITEAAEALKSTGLSPVLTSPRLHVAGSGNMAIYTLTRHIHLIHTSGESVYMDELEWPVLPDKGRPPDKAFAIAITTSLAYFLRDLLLMPRGAQDDMDAHTEEPSAAPAPTEERKPAETPAPATPATEVITVEQRDELTKLMTEAQTDHQRFCDHYHIKGVSTLPSQHYQDARSKLLAKLKPTAQQSDRIDALCAQLKLGTSAATRKLREFLPDVKDFASLTRLQAELVVDVLAKSAAAQKAKTPR